MIPGHIVMLDEFPRNVNGKIDKKQLITNFAKSNL
jgi:non-ribosomal peptide synthetase component E (peptide arylation enzyme)